MEELFATKDLVFLEFLHYPDVCFREGGFTFLTGPSGCGKSTLLHLMNGTYSPSGGQILFRGVDVETLEPIAHRRKVLLCRQSPSLFDQSIAENFRTFFGYRDQTPPSEEEMAGYLAVCQAEFDLEQNCATLSGGERARVYQAICLSMKPEVLLLDEPTAALDKETAHGLMARLSDYGKENHLTIIAVCHDPSLVEEWATDVVALEGRGGV